MYTENVHRIDLEEKSLCVCLPPDRGTGAAKGDVRETRPNYIR
jgi:hypothetical protein